MTQQPTQAPLVAEALNLAEHWDYDKDWVDQVRLLLPDLARQLEQANKRIEWFERHSDISAAELEQAERRLKLADEDHDITERHNRERAEQAEREKERNTAIAKWALEQCRMWWKGARRDMSNVNAALAELDRMDKILSEQNTKPSGEVGEEAFFSGHLQEARMLRRDEAIEDAFNDSALPPKEGS